MTFRVDVQRKLASPVMGRSRKMRGHRRQLSEPRIYPPFSPIKEDGNLESDYDRVCLLNSVEDT